MYRVALSKRLQVGKDYFREHGLNSQNCTISLLNSGLKEKIIHQEEVCVPAQSVKHHECSVKS